jgi:hypothetical protein
MVSAKIPQNPTWRRLVLAQMILMICLTGLVVEWILSQQLIKTNNQRKRKGNKSSLLQPRLMTMTIRWVSLRKRPRSQKRMKNVGTRQRRTLLPPTSRLIKCSTT